VNFPKPLKPLSALGVSTLDLLTPLKLRKHPMETIDRKFPMWTNPRGPWEDEEQEEESHTGNPKSPTGSLDNPIGHGLRSENPGSPTENLEPPTQNHARSPQSWSLGPQNHARPPQSWSLGRPPQLRNSGPLFQQEIEIAEAKVSAGAPLRMLSLPPYPACELDPWQ
jgi:hypothetical protein